MTQFNDSLAWEAYLSRFAPPLCISSFLSRFHLECFRLQVHRGGRPLFVTFSVGQTKHGSGVLVVDRPIYPTLGEVFRSDTRFSANELLY